MATFSDTGWLLLITLIKIAVVVLIMLTAIAYLTWLERKVVAHIQSRWGPYLVGYSGLLQPLADGMKFILKEDIVPLEADKIVYWLAPFLALAQVTIEFWVPDATVSNAIETIAAASRANCPHALVLCPREDTSDGQLLRVIEQAHGASANTQVVIHPPMPTGEQQGSLDRRWAALLDQAIATHADTRLALRLPPPTGLR